MSYYGQPIRSPETKAEVKAAANVLNVLGVIFAVIALVGIGLSLAYSDPENLKKNLILSVVCGSVSLPLFAAGAYNRYYTRRMEHAPLVAAALRRPGITVCVIIAVITALVIGGVSLLIYWQ
ncbi:MAG: hypothetical protein M3384_03995 [Acidobacteriota bacterium]|nr:hypothetical protein [Acidobacteriota bacterium]